MKYIIPLLLLVGLAACDEVGPCTPEKAAMAAKAYEVCVQTKQSDEHGFGSLCGKNAAQTYCTNSSNKKLNIFDEVDEDIK